MEKRTIRSIRRERPIRKRVPFFPTLSSRLLVLFILTAIALGLIAYEWPAPFGDPADPTDTHYIPRPEWWVLFLNQLVTIFSGPFSVIGTVLAPGALIFLLVAVPFMDRSAERSPRRRTKTLLVATGILLLLGALTAVSYYEHFVKPPPLKPARGHPRTRRMRPPALRTRCNTSLLSTR